MRHGQAISNVKNLVSSWPEKFENPLTEKGKEMIKQSANGLADKSIDLIFTSPLLRAKMSAEIAGKILGVKPKIDKRLREVGFGVFSGGPLEKM